MVCFQRKGWGTSRFWGGRGAERLRPCWESVFLAGMKRGGGGDSEAGRNLFESTCEVRGKASDRAVRVERRGATCLGGGETKAEEHGPLEDALFKGRSCSRRKGKSVLEGPPFRTKEEIVTRARQYGQKTVASGERETGGKIGVFVQKNQLDSGTREGKEVQKDQFSA